MNSNTQGIAIRYNEEEALRLAIELAIANPHANVTIKPAHRWVISWDTDGVSSDGEGYE